jgi:Ca2+-binding RTX toxin-like protein
VKLIRNGLVVAAVAAVSIVLPTTAAHAADTRLVVTSFTGPGSQDWHIDETGTDTVHPYEFVAGNNPPVGRGSLQFSARENPASSDKIYMWHTFDLKIRDFRRASFDYFIDQAYESPTPPDTRARQFYLNIYVQTPATGNTWFDCKYDYVATDDRAGVWHRVVAQRETTATRLDPRSLSTCGDQLSDLGQDDVIFRIAVNAGDTSADDNQMDGGLDNVVLRTRSGETVYDFESPASTPPAADCGRTGLNPITGTGGNDRLDGTSRDDAIELRGGNDITDARGGDDCVLGGDGSDRISAGSGADNVQGGRGSDSINGDSGDDTISGGEDNDQIDAGAGKDSVDAGAGNDFVRARDGRADFVDCGPGNDIVIADRDDDVRNCETRA